VKYIEQCATSCLNFSYACSYHTFRLWNNDQEPETAAKAWDRLTEEEKRAAAILGFNRKKWDMDGSTTTGSGNDYDDIDWKDLPKEVKKAARTLGYTESIWNNDGDSPLEEKGWSELTVEQRNAAKLIGFDQRRWDDGSDALPSYDHLSWEELPADVQVAAKYLKYTESIWDDDGQSPLDDKDWDELSAKQQDAARVLGKFKGFSCICRAALWPYILNSHSSCSCRIRSIEVGRRLG
jgi:hypothetical protein